VTPVPENSALWRTLGTLQQVPEDQPVALLIRHSSRDAIPEGGAGIDLALNALGVSLCEELGRALPRRIKSIHSSPVPRCVQTGELLAQFAGCDVEVTLDQRLGAPGVYVLDEQVAWQNWLALGNDGVINHMVAGSGALPGMADPTIAAHELLGHMLQRLGAEPGLHLFVSHDSIVAPTVARLMGVDLPADLWPEFLEAAAFWPEGGRVMAGYRGLTHPM
jgi:broad specificity phosphatase PhoE